MVVVVVKALNIQTTLEFTLDGPRGKVLAMDGVIFSWRSSFDANSPFELIATLSDHTKATTCLTVDRMMLFSGSMDHSINVWDLETLQCKMTLNRHTYVVTSLICWDSFSLSSSSDCTIEIFRKGPLVCKKKVVQSIEIGLLGLFFTGDGTGLLMVWRWLELSKVTSSRKYSLPLNYCTFDESDIIHFPSSEL
ncbi:unnamed protein product [Lupinus luteus]|uniref:Uncharacterized protein n=1 Tax=Lupinus luteus TaxID=3873 RepID=A0AAV1YHD7_LUPLU